MTIENRRYQHPVGQGFFHTGGLYESGDLRFSYVYDCGAMHRYANAREREIDKYLTRAGAGSRLDILFLSHIHADHVNGLNQLLDPNKGISVDTIVLPLIDVVDRLIAFARTAVDDPASAQDAFYRDFVLDPATTLERFGPRQIIFISPGDRDSGAPDGSDRPLSPLDSKFEISSEKREANCRLVGKGTVSELSPLSATGQSRQSSTQLLQVPDTAAFAVDVAQDTWLLAPYVDRTIKAHRSTFLDELSRQCGIPRSKLDSWLDNTVNIHELITQNRDRLAAAYGAITSDLNITSLCLYSGPEHRKAQNSIRHIRGFFGCVYHQNSGQNTRIARLSTGDAALGQAQRRADFVAHYDKLLNEVVTLTLPHHGSDHNFDPDLLHKIKPLVCVAAADSYATWKHPGPHTVQAVCSLPAVLQVVTSKVRSRAQEWAILG